MADFHVYSASGAQEYSNRTWSSGERMVPGIADASTNFAVARRWVWEVTTGGTSTAIPAWPSSVSEGDTLSQNGVVWTARKPGYSAGGVTMNWTFATIYCCYVCTAANLAAGDRVLVDSRHSETGTANGTLVFSGTAALPNKFWSVDGTATPPTARLAGALITTTSNQLISLNGYVDPFGITGAMGTGANTQTMVLGATTVATQTYESCKFFANTTGSSGGINLGSGSVNRIGEYKNCELKFGATGQRMIANGTHIFRGGSITSGSATPTSIFTQATGPGSHVEFHGFDFSNLASTFNFHLGGALTQVGSLYINNCKLPASWSGNLFASAMTVPGFRAVMRNCDSGDTHLKYRNETLRGYVRDETTIMRSSGAADESQGYCLAMVSSANVSFPGSPLRAGPIYKRAASVGSGKVITVEILHDSLTDLNDNEIWVEVEYMGTLNFPLALFVDDRLVNAMASGAAQTSSSVTWTTTGLTNPRKQKLVTASFTPQEIGYYEITVCLAKASYTVYFDPLVDVT